MERYCSTGQSPQRAVAPTEGGGGGGRGGEEEEEEEACRQKGHWPNHDIISEFVVVYCHS